MNTCKLIFRNVCKNIRDYLIYFLTLTLSVSLFYAFNSISDQPAFSNMGMTGTLLYRQLGIMLSTLSTMIAVVLAFLILYANQFLLKRRKKELGVYMMLGMKKGRISRLFAGETLCVGIIALGTGLLLGFFFSQGFSLIALRLFAINLEKFRIVFSAGALRQTVLCFTIIFFIVMLFNIRSVTNVKLIDLLTDGRKNESMQTENRILPVCLFLLSLLCIGISAALFNKNGILPSHENNLFQLAAAALVAGTFLLFYSLSAVFMQAASARKCFYLKGLNTFLVRQIGSKIRTNYLVVTVVCGLLTITICAVSIGASTALAMNKMSRSATPYDLNVLSNVSVDGDSDIAAYLAAHDITISNYAKATEQISVYEADMTYSELFEGQKVKFWPIDEKVPDSKVSVISISDLNRALAMQNKAPIALNDGQYLLNCNYNGTYRYVAAALQSHPEITVGGATLQRAEDKVLQETYVMTSVGNNDRGTLIVPDSVTASLEKDVNALLVQYEPNADSNEILQKMIPIGLDSTHGYRYAEKNMMYETFYGLDALVSFLCCYIGLVFLLICAALLALKQLTETTDNVYRYGLLQKLGAGRRQIDHTLFVQTVVFFAIPLVVAGVYSAFLIGKAMAVVAEFI